MDHVGTLHPIRAALVATATALLTTAVAADQLVVDLADISTEAGVLLRVYGNTGTGALGVPVAGGLDTDGDNHADFAFAAMTASPSGRSGAGEVYLVFGDGRVRGTLDTAVTQANVLKFIGDVNNEAAGSEIWIDDVTGDGLGDLLIARQNFNPAADRVGAGALTIVVGSAALRTHAATLEPVDLRTPPVALTLTTFHGDGELARLGIWVRTGDVTGDGIADIVVAADQTTEMGETHRGAIYVIRGGPHLAVSQIIDLANFGATALVGHIARVTPPPGAAHYHFGATVQIGDLDGNGRGEVLAAAALNRAGATILPSGSFSGTVHANGGTTDGTLYIAWDDNFTGVWPAGFTFEVTAGPGSHTVIDGASCNIEFGEELLAGLDYDGDGTQDLFVGDVVGNCAASSRPQAGSGHVFFDASGLKGLDFDYENPPIGLTVTNIYGAAAGALASDTALHGDFDADGIDDLSLTSPHASPQGRINAGALHVLFGKDGMWPDEVDLAALPAIEVLRIAEIQGAQGTSGSDSGDTLGYSAAAGDIDGDGRIDVITNEMVGNGVSPAAQDVGNLLVISGRLVTGATSIPALGPVGLAGVGLTLLGLGSRLRGKGQPRGQ